MPKCTIRLLREGDLEACEAIYRLNEPAHFPPGYFPKFADWLRNGRALILVAEQDGAVRALGGVNAQDRDGRYIASLSFGMVHPAYHRQGFGTALLLARLALLQSTKEYSFACLTTAGGSETFYGRFGFSFVNAVQATPEYLQRHYVVRVSTQDKARCAKALEAIFAAPLPREVQMPPLTDLNAVAGEATV